MFGGFVFVGRAFGIVSSLARRQCVLIPETAEDEMEAEWSTTTGCRHTRELHDGELTLSADHVQKLYADLQTSTAANPLTGEAAAPAAPKSSPMAGQAAEAGASQDSAKKASGGSAKKGDEDVDDDEDVEDNAPVSLLSMLGGPGPSSSRPASSAPLAEVPPAVANPNAKSKAKAKARGKAQAAPNAPPPLSKGSAAGAGGRRAGAAGAAPDVAPDRAERDSKSQLAKLEVIATDFSQMQRASIILMDKKHYKLVKNLTDSLASKKSAVSKEPSARITKTLKESDVICKVGKAFKLWCRKGALEDFMQEFEEAEKFAADEPKIQVSYPCCIKQAIQEMMFQRKLPDILNSNDSEGMMKRYRLISKDAVQGLFTTDELVEWQKALAG